MDRARTSFRPETGVEVANIMKKVMIVRYEEAILKRAEGGVVSILKAKNWDGMLNIRSYMVRFSIHSSIVCPYPRSHDTICQSIQGSRH